MLENFLSCCWNFEKHFFEFRVKVVKIYDISGGLEDWKLKLWRLKTKVKFQTGDPRAAGRPDISCGPQKSLYTWKTY